MSKTIPPNNRHDPSGEIVYEAGCKVTPDPTYPHQRMRPFMFGKIHTVRKVGRTVVHATADIGGQKRSFPASAWLPATKKNLAFGREARMELM